MNDPGERQPGNRRASRRQPRVLPPLLAAVALVGLGVGVWVAAPSSFSGVHARATTPEPTAERTRAMSPRSACLLTDSSGLSRDPAATVWAGIQDATLALEARASFLALAVSGPPESQANALIAQRCTVIIAVGTKPVAAVRSIAAGAPQDVRLAIAGTGSTDGRVVTFTGSRADTKTTVTRLLNGSPS